jgi:hypothetical protein
MLKYYENDYAKYFLKDQILHIIYKSGVCIDLKAAVQIVKDRLVFHEGLFHPVLCDVRGVTEVNKSARDYFALEGSTLINAVAFIIESPVSKILSQFYLKTSNPPIPTKYFEQISEALNYLNEYLS